MSYNIWHFQVLLYYELFSSDPGIGTLSHILIFDQVLKNRCGRRAKWIDLFPSYSTFLKYHKDLNLLWQVENKSKESNLYVSGQLVYFIKTLCPQKQGMLCLCYFCSHLAAMIMSLSQCQFHNAKYSLSQQTNWNKMWKKISWKVVMCFKPKKFFRETDTKRTKQISC